MNKTEMLLLVKYETPIIPLEKICEEYFGCAKGTAKQKAKAGLLPIPAFRLGTSQKRPWIVNISDLAIFIDDTYEKAKSELASLNQPQPLVMFLCLITKAVNLFILLNCFVANFD